MRGPQFGRVNLFQDANQTVLVESAAGMHGKWCRLVDGDKPLVFIENTNVNVHVWFCCVRENVFELISRADDVGGNQWMVVPQQVASLNALSPGLPG